MQRKRRQSPFFLGTGPVNCWVKFRKQMWMARAQFHSFCILSHFQGCICFILIKSGRMRHVLLGVHVAWQVIKYNIRLSLASIHPVISQLYLSFEEGPVKSFLCVLFFARRPQTRMLCEESQMSWEESLKMFCKQHCLEMSEQSSASASGLKRRKLMVIWGWTPVTHCWKRSTDPGAPVRNAPGVHRALVRWRPDSWGALWGAAELWDASLKWPLFYFFHSLSVSSLKATVLLLGEKGHSG